MKILWILPLFLVSLSAFAGQGTGLGVTVGNPNGATGRTWLRPDRSIDFGAGWAITNNSKFELYSDYLWEMPALVQINKENFDFFFGAGLVMRNHAGQNENELTFGPRIPGGISYSFAEPNLELFSVVAANLGLIPAREVWVDFHLGARFYLF